MRIAMLALSVFALAGCQAPTAPDEGSTSVGRVLVLEALYVLEEEGHGFNGHHCPDAYVRDGMVFVNQDMRSTLGEPFLLIEPDTEGMWATLGDGGYAMALPADVASEASGDNDPWVRVSIGDGVVEVNGETRSLPHSFTLQRDGYRIEATLRDGPDQVEWFERGMCM